MSEIAIGDPVGRPGWERVEGGGSALLEGGNRALSGSIWPAELRVSPNGDGTWRWFIEAAHGGEFAHEVNTGGYEFRGATEEEAQLVAERRLWSIVSSMHSALADRGLGVP